MMSRGHTSAAGRADTGDARKTAEGLTYLSGFGNEHSSEAVPGALPRRAATPRSAPPSGSTRSS